MGCYVKEEIYFVEEMYSSRIWKIPFITKHPVDEKERLRNISKMDFYSFLNLFDLFLLDLLLSIIISIN